MNEWIELNWRYLTSVINGYINLIFPDQTGKNIVQWNN